MALDFGHAWRRPCCRMDLFFFCPGAHTTPQNHPTAASFYGDSSRINQGVALKCPFNAVLYIYRFDRRLYSYPVVDRYYPYKGEHGFLGGVLLVPPVYLATQSNQPVLHLHFDAIPGHRDIPFHSIRCRPGDLFV